MPVWDGDRLHVFFQHNPDEARWGNMHWGHASSADLLRWELHPHALAPDGPHDHAGVFTGCVVRDGDTWWAFYTGVTGLKPLEQLQCAARSRDLSSWEKLPAPLLDRPPAGFAGCWRDPLVWHDDGWHMLLGAEQGGGAALHYAATDLDRWRYRGVFYADHYGDTGIEFECPDLLTLGRQQVLLTSASAHRSGPWKRSYVHLLQPSAGSSRYRRSWTALDTGCLYAVRTAHLGPRLLFGWIEERRSEADQLASGWSGVLSLPRELYLRGREVCQRPWSGLRRLRGAHQRLEARTVHQPWSLGAPIGEELRLRSSGPLRLRIGDHELVVPQHARELALFVDRSVVELVPDRGPSHTARVYGADRELVLRAPEPVTVEGDRWTLG